MFAKSTMTRCCNFALLVVGVVAVILALSPTIRLSALGRAVAGLEVRLEVEGVHGREAGRGEVESSSTPSTKVLINGREAVAVCEAGDEFGCVGVLLLEWGKEEGAVREAREVRRSEMHSIVSSCSA